MSIRTGVAFLNLLKFDCMKPRPFFSHSASAEPAGLTGITSSPCEPKISVHQIVSQLITSLQPFAVKRNNILLNDIPKELSVSADQHTLAYVLSQLVNSAVNSTENQCIHIEAVLTDDHTMIRVKDLNTHIYHTMEIGDKRPN